jgi:hypothetical protein
MEFAWWEAVAIFVLFAAQFVLPVFWGDAIRVWITYAFFAWTVFALLDMLRRKRRPAALTSFLETWRAHVAG